MLRKKKILLQEISFEKHRHETTYGTDCFPLPRNFNTSTVSLIAACGGVSKNSSCAAPTLKHDCNNAACFP